MKPPGRARVVGSLGLAQTLAWASSYYLLAILAAPIARDLGVSTPTVFGAFSVALVASALLGPMSGRAIDRFGGRPVLIASSFVFAAGLSALGLATGPWSLFLAWVVIGLGMGAGLYESAFAALVHLYGKAARAPITGITLFAGFASTIGWPLTAWLEMHWGWRGACFAWAAAHVLVALPLYALLPGCATTGSEPRPDSAADALEAAPAAPAGSAALLAVVFAVTWFVSTAMAAHLPRLLQDQGLSLASALLFAGLVGPAQVAGRLMEYGFLRRVHPLLSARIASTLHSIGAVVFLGLGGPAGAAMFTVLHGAGNGILTIAKGTLPLFVFGSRGYGERQGMLMVPARFAQAAAPFAFGLAVDRWGGGALWLSCGLALASFAALLALKADGKP